MDEPVKDATATDPSIDPLADRTDLTPEQRELLRSLHRSFQQAVRGEVMPFEDLLRELRQEREAEENAANSDGGV